MDGILATSRHVQDARHVEALECFSRAAPLIGLQGRRGEVRFDQQASSTAANCECGFAILMGGCGHDRRSVVWSTYDSVANYKTQS